LKSFSFNKEILDLLNIDRIVLNEASEGFEVLKSIHCPNWVSFNIKFLQLKMGLLGNEKGFSLQRDDLYIIKAGNIIDKVVMGKEE